MQNYYTFDGVPLTDPQGRWMLAEGTGIRIVPSKSNHSYTIPGVDGTLSNNRATFEESNLEIVLAVLTNQSHEAMMKTVEFLHGLFAQRHRLIPLVHHYGDGSSRVTQVRVVASISNEMRFMRAISLKIICSVPGVFWRGLENLIDSVAVQSTLSAHTLTSFSGSTGPINDAILRFVGPFATASITDTISGDKIIVTEPAVAGQSVIVNTVNWSATKGAVDVSTNVTSNRGLGTMMTFNPSFDSNGDTSISVMTQGTNLTTATRVEVEASRSFL